MRALHLAVALPPAVSTRAQPRRCRRRLPAAAGGAGDPSGSPADPQALLQRAAALRAQQEALEKEAAQLAAALEGLPAAEQRAVLEALGAQRRAQQQGEGLAAAGQSLEQRQEEKEEAGEEEKEQQQQAKGGRPRQAPAYVAGKDERAPAWEAALPPELRQLIQEAGMEETLRQHAAAVRAAVGEEGEATGAGNEEEVEAIARIIEEGGELPPLVPDGYFEGDPEPGDQFAARVQGSVDYVETDLKGSKHFRPPPPDPNLSPEERAVLAAAEAAARQHTASAFVVHRALQYSQVPELAAAYARGWETAKAVDAQWHDLKAESYATQQEEVPQSIPPPTIPPEAEREYRAAERVAFVLRRAHKDSSDPTAPLRALQSKGLLSEGFMVEDPFMVCEGPEAALGYLGRWRQAGAKLENTTIMCRCLRYEPRMVWSVTLDCLIHMPYPVWFFAWLALNQGAEQQIAAQQASSAAAGAAAAAAAGSAAEQAASQPAVAGAAIPRGPLAGISSADADAALAAAAAEKQRQWLEDFALLSGMLQAAEEAADAVGQPLDNDGRLAVLMAGADVIMRRQQAQQEARQAEMEAAVDVSAAADEAALERQERWWQALREGGPAAEAARAEIEAAIAAAEAPAEQLPPPRLVGVHKQPYEYEGQRREHRWVFIDYEAQHRQRGRQQFDLYPRHPEAAAAAAEAAAAEAAELEALGEEGLAAAQARWQAEQRRQFALLPPAEVLLQQEWGGSQGDGPEQQGQQATQQAQQDRQQAQQPPASQQQQQAGGAPAGAASAGSKKKRRQASGGKQGKQQKGQQQPPKRGQADEEPAEEEPEEELFPFTFDWEKQERRRRAGHLLRRLFGDKLDTLMGQLPKRGARLGRNSNAALALEDEQEGTQWLGGECMTINATFNYTIDTAGSGQVETCTVTWGSVHGVGLQEVTDAFDIWVEATGMLHQAECDADEEIRAALEEEDGGWEDSSSSSSSLGGAPSEPAEFARGATWLPLWRM